MRGMKIARDEEGRRRHLAPLLMALLRGGWRVVVCSGRVGCGGRVVRLALELGIVLLGQPLDCVATHRWLEHVVAVEGELLEARVEHGRDEPELLDRIGQLGVEACDQATVVELARARLPDLDSTMCIALN